MSKEDFISDAETVWLTPKQLAARWNCAVRSLANLRAKGQGPKYYSVTHLGVRYREVDILAFERIAARLGKA